MAKRGRKNTNEDVQFIFQKRVMIHVKIQDRRS